MFLFSGKKLQNQIDQLERNLSSMDQKIMNSFGGVRKDVDDIQEWIGNNFEHNQHIEARLYQLEVAIGKNPSREEVKQLVDYYYQYQQNSTNTLVAQISQKSEGVESQMVEVRNDLGKLGEKSKALGIELENLQNEQNTLKSECSELKEEQRMQFAGVESTQSEVFGRLKALTEEIDALKSSQSTQIQQPEALPQAIPSQIPVQEDKFKLLADKIDQIGQNKQSSALKEKILRKVAKHSKEYLKSMLLTLIKKYQRIGGQELREIMVEEQGLLSKSSFYRLLIEIEEEDGVEMIQEGKNKLYLWSEAVFNKKK